ncbi:MAG TPA: response regulator [Candidatus Acidoferrum sp.]|nr:response regulator [Candidatus Acidoferrum sp.]
MDADPQRKKVLYVEDDDLDLMAMQRAFAAEHLGEWLHVTRDGAQALDWLQGAGVYADRSKHPFPDLLLMDIRMPKVSGLEVLRWVRDRPSLSNLPIIMFSGSDLADDIADAYRVGANLYLCKPVGNKLRAVVRFIAAWLDLEPAPSANKPEWGLRAAAARPIPLRPAA